jgi:arsenate reductase
MAEALINHDLAPAWQAASAGTHPAGYVHPKAIAALGELGIDFAGRSKSTDEFRGQWFDAVVTVCDSANEDCPIWLQAGRRLHISFPDPAKAEGSEEQIMAVFRKVRDDIRRDVEAALQS